MRERPAGSGIWQWRIRQAKDPVTGVQRVITRTIHAKTKAAAEKQVRQLLADLEDNPTSGTTAPFSVVLEKWMEMIEVLGRSPSTLFNYRNMISNSIEPALGHIPLNELSAAHLDAFYVKMLKKDPPITAATVKRHHAVIRAALQQAFKWGWVDENVALRASPPAEVRGKVVAPSAVEVRKLLNAFSDVEDLRVHGIGAAIAAATGMRRGEICALRWSSMEGNVFVVKESVWEADGKIGIKSTKTNQERLVPVLPELEAGLLEWRRECEARAALVDAQITDDCFIISTWPDFTVPMRPSTFSQAFRRVAIAEGLGHIHLHSFRHFVATELFATGLAARTVADVLGHSDPSLTMKVYTHTSVDRQRAALNTLTGILKPIER